mgnify:CR=1 FL=1
MKKTETNRRNTWLRETLSVSRKEAVASSAMTGICDNYLGAFAIFLRASLPQMGQLAALPQLAGALFQLLSVWLCSHFHRRHAIVGGVILQALAVFGMALVALIRPEYSVSWLIGLAVVYHACANFVQPQWRSWMGSLVPARRRGAFFSGRTRLTMITSFAVFALGGATLGWFEQYQLAWAGFFLLLLLASLGRGLSAWQLHKMHDPDQHNLSGGTSFIDTLGRVRESFRHRGFREYSLFFAAMQGAVAISGPFFSVYMLNDLGYSYWAFTGNIGVSILTQFFTLSTWGQICDRWGNRLVMVTSTCMLPLLPALWLVSDSYYYLLSVQIMSGLAWGGFTLSTANYLYELRPARADFASYAAVQSSLSAVFVFFGALLGGYFASVLPQLVALLPTSWQLQHSVVLIFATSSLLRIGIAAWFIPRSVELRVRQRPDIVKVIYRITRFTPGAGVVLDWLTVTRKK